MKNNIKVGEFQCEDCGKMFASKNELIEHRNQCDSFESGESLMEETNPEEDSEEEEADKKALDEHEHGERSLDETENPEEEAEKHSKDKNKSQKPREKRMR